jgi:adenosylmethionine-8-amino-7-oxononanoate aminotransferase
MELESELSAALQLLIGVGPAIGVRSGTGAMAAIQLDPADPTLAPRVAAAARKAGVITRAIAGNGLQISPPLIFTAENVLEMTEGLRIALGAI